MSMNLSIRRSSNRKKDALHKQRGQTVVLVIAALGVFLLGFVGLATDYTNFWFHRQTAQGAADAACQAGSMDLLMVAQGTPTPVGATFTKWGGNTFTPGTNFVCASSDARTPCKYANFNGYSSSGLVANAQSNQVAISFPARPGTLPAIPAQFPVGTVSYMQVEVTDRVQAFFSYLITRTKTLDIRSSARCGLIPASAPTPIILMHPSASRALNVRRNSQTKVYGGPKRSIEINSSSTTSIRSSGGDIDLTVAGPSNDGDLGVFGGPATKPSAVHLGPGGSYIFPSSPFADPFAQIAAPAKPAAAPAKVPRASGVNGCPSSGGCNEYYPGYYAHGLSINHETALISPGIYWIEGGDLSLGTDSLVRPSSAAGTGSNDIGGAMFYFNDASSLYVNSRSGRRSGSTYTIAGSGSIPGVACTGTPSVPNLPATLDGNVFLGPCSGTYAPYTGYRGFVVMQNRGVSAVTSWAGGDNGMIAAGLFYFHYSAAGPAGSDNLSIGCSNFFFITCSSTFFDFFLPCYFAFSSEGDDDDSSDDDASGSVYMVGNLVTDRVTVCGNSNLRMVLTPTGSSLSVLKAQLLP